MKNVNISEFSSTIFNLSEETVYNIIKKFDNHQSIDKTLTYVYVKAFYMHIVKIYFSNQNNLKLFDSIISEYRKEISTYYKMNNKQISNELLEDILNAFDKSFEIIETLQFNDLSDGYELRHHVIDAFDILRQILGNKSKTNIRTDIFENNISEIRNQAEKILDYVIECNISE